MGSSLVSLLKCLLLWFKGQISCFFELGFIFDSSVSGGCLWAKSLPIFMRMNSIKYSI